MYIGAHVSASGGPAKAVPRAIADRCECFQIFTKNSNTWKQRMWTEKEANAFKTAYAKGHFKGVVSHTSYLINLCSATPEKREKSYHALADEFLRCQLLGIPYMVLHPGSPTTQGREWGIAEIARQINQLFDEQGDAWPDVTLLFENTAGQGSAIGYKFEELAEIFSQLDHPELFGVCFDTCHAFAAGYDITTRQGYEDTIKEFDEIVGLDRLKVFHLNDSKKCLGSRVDRHEDIGSGFIGQDTFEFLVNDERFSEHLGILETPFAEGNTPNLANVEIVRGLRKKEVSKSEC